MLLVDKLDFYIFIKIYKHINIIQLQKFKLKYYNYLFLNTLVLKIIQILMNFIYMVNLKQQMVEKYQNLHLKDLKK